MDYSEIDRLMASEDSSDRRMAATMLGEEKDDAAVERLVVLLRDVNSGVRDAAQNALMFLGGRTAVERVAPLVAETDPGLRNAAIDILRKIGDDGLDVMHRLAVDENDDIRLFVLDILGTIGNPESVDVLIGSLNDRDSNVRNAAVVSLGLLGDPKAFESLKPLVDDEEWIRFSAIEAMSHMPHEDLPAFLLEQLDRFKHDELMASALLETLGKIRPKESAASLIAMLETANAFIEAEIVKALLKILSPDEIAGLAASEAAVIRSIVEAHLAEADDEVLTEMLSVIARIGNRASVHALIDLARTIDPDTQADKLAMVNDALCQLGDVEVMVGLLDADDKLKILASGVLAGVRKGAREICERIGAAQGPVKRAMVDALAAIGGTDLRSTFRELLTDVDGHVVSSSLIALGRTGEKDDISSLVPYLSHRYPDVREAALNSIILIGTERAEEVFMGLCRDEGAESRIVGLNGLDRMKSPRLGEVAERLLQDADWEVRAQAVSVIRDRELPITTDMIRALLKDEHEQIRFAAIDMVGIKRVDDLRPLLDAAASGDNMWAAAHAIEALGMFRDTPAKEKLLGMLSCSSDFLRISAIKTLGTWGEEDLASELEACLDDANPDVARAAIDAIDRLQGVSF